MFPRIEHISQVLPALEGHPEFQVRERDGYTVIDYAYALPDSFDCPIRRECRGIKFGPSGEILARPFHKFFNLGEKPETQPHALDLSRLHVVTEKLDGSMVHPAIVTDKDDFFVFMTRAGITSIAQAARSVASPEVKAFCGECMREGRTPIFEYTAPDNRIVIAYPEPRLTLLAVRDNVTGAYLDLPTGALPLVPRLASLTEEYIKLVRLWKTKEGIVVRFEDGLHVKLKADDYVLRHRAKDEIGREKNAVEVVVRDADDDLVAILPEAEAEALASFAYELRRRIRELVGRAMGAVEEGRGMERKRFALEVVAGLPALLKPVAFRALDGADVREALREQLLRACGSGPRLEAVLEENHLPRWRDYWQVREEEPQ